MSEIYRTKEQELDIEAARFLKDLDIALGHAYGEPGLALFPDFSPDFGRYSTLPLIERLVSAYQQQTSSAQKRIVGIIHEALWKCARSPQGIRRSLTCLDLAHEIDPAICTSEIIFSDLLFRQSNDEYELANWLWEIVRRLRDWNIKIVLTPTKWEKTMNLILPKGIFALLKYYEKNVSDQENEILNKLCDIAIRRADDEKELLYNFGQNYYLLKTKIRDIQLSRILLETKENKNISSYIKEGLDKLVLCNLPPQIKTA